LKDINEKARFYTKEIWNLNFDLAIKINTKFKNTLGCLVYSNKTPKEIELSKYMFDNNYNELTIDDVLIHD
jgi:hypothetical protein